MAKILLSLETVIPDRDWIEIDGQKFDIRYADELAISQAARMRRLSQEIIFQKMGADSGEEDLKKLEDYANEVLALIVVDLPRAILDKLSLLNKFKIVSAFNSVTSHRAAEVTPVQRSPLTAEGSSPVSAGSTEVH